MTKVKVLHFSPHDENCGVGKYQENFMAEYKTMSDEIETKFFDVSPYQTRQMDQVELDGVLSRLKTELANYDILHIQHEFGLFTGEEFARIVEAAKSVGKKVVITVHLSPALAFKFEPRGGIGPRSMIHVVRQKRLHGIFEKRHIDGFRAADLLITHNNGATASLVRYGISKDKILQYFHPVLPVTKPKVNSTEIADNLHKKSGDIIFSTIGYMHKYKGIQEAVRALRYLPGNYKLAIIGGMQPVSDENNIYNTIATLIDTLDLKDRVYITGYVEDDDRLNALIRETDMCVYPYNNDYYGQTSSGALNLAFANERPVIAYPVDTFKECNEFGQIVVCGAASYYELAREIARVEINKLQRAGAEYAQKYSWHNIATVTLDEYRKI